MESYFKRWASVAVSVRSFAATNSMSGLLSPARTTFLPIRPKPLIPTLVAIYTSILRTGFKDSGHGDKVSSVGQRSADCRQGSRGGSPHVSVGFLNFHNFTFAEANESHFSGRIAIDPILQLVTFP